MTPTSYTSDSLIDISKIPNLPHSLIKLIDMCNSKDRDLQKIGSLIAADASLSARVLQLANSAFIGSRSTFTDIGQAVIYLGIDSVRNLAISVSVFETFNSVNTDGTLNLSRFWHHSFLTAVIAKTFSEKRGYADPAEAYLAGLLHDIGKLLLFVSFPKKYRLILAQESSGNILPILEKNDLGVTHYEASSLLVSQWNLQQSVSDAVFSHHDELQNAQKLNTLGKIIWAANRLSNSLLVEKDAPDLSAEKLLGIDASYIPELITEILASVEQVTSDIGIHGNSDPLVQSLPSEHIQTNRVRLARKVQAISTIGGVLDNLLKAENLTRIVRIIEESFQILFNIRCCLLLLPDADGGVMRIHLSGSNEHQKSKERSLPVTIGETGIISECLKTEEILHATSTEKFSIDAIEIQCMHLLDSDGLLTIPVPLEKSAHGVLVAGVREAESKAIFEHQETLSLLAGQVGMRIRLERLQQQAADEQINALNRIARQIAHEINNPLGTLQNYLVTMSMKLDQPSNLQEDLDLITDEIQHITKITAQLNDLSSTQMGDDYQKVDVNQIVTNAVEFYKQSLQPESSITMLRELDDTLPLIQTSASGIRQITGNLIKNGIEALGDGGTLTIKTSVSTESSENSEHIKIIVEDNGPGTPVDLADTIFTAGVTTKGSGHVGLGLAITRKIVADLGGSISYAAGKTAGTRFAVSLPVKSK